MVRPQALEPGCRVRATQRPDLAGQLLGVLADRRVRGLREVLVVAQPAAHQVTGLDRVLAEQRLQPQRPVRPGLGRRRLAARGTGGAAAGADGAGGAAAAPACACPDGAVAEHPASTTRHANRPTAAPPRGRTHHLADLMSYPLVTSHRA